MREEPLQRLVVRLRKSGFAIESVTKEYRSVEPIMKITTPDGVHESIYKESEYFRDPEGLERNILEQYRRLGYIIVN